MKNRDRALGLSRCIYAFHAEGSLFINRQSCPVGLGDEAARAQAIVSDTI